MSLPAPQRNSLRKEENIMATLTATQQLTASINPKDRKGNAAQVADVTWASSDETVATVVPSADGKSALVVAGAPGSGRITVNADADLGEGVSPLIGELAIDVTAGTATVIDVTAGAPEEQP